MMLLGERKRNKFNAVKTKVDGITFHSKKEAKRYCELKLMERSGHIYGLKLQPKYALFVNHVLVCHYYGDFEYSISSTNELVTEDVKSEATMTDTAKLKMKMFMAQTGRRVLVNYD